MTDKDSTQLAPKVSPHYQCLIHPLVHDPHSFSYLDCLDILDNAVNLLGLFRHLDLDENGDHGGLSTGATGSLFRLAKTLEDTLEYVGHNLEDAWWQREADSLKALQQSALFKALQNSTSNDRAELLGNIAALLNVASTDVEVFIGMIEQQNSAGEVKEPTGIYLVQ